MKKLMRVMAIFCAGVLTVCAQEIPPETLQLAHIRFHMLEQLREEPNYTCVESVERSRRAGAKKSFQLQDTLRLEVALVDRKEMFAWPGAKKFESADVRDLVKNGAIGNGNFAGFAGAIFEGSITFSYKGMEGEWARYDYHVPLLQSGYSIQHGSREAKVAYHGSVFANLQTLDVHRIEVIAEDIPPEVELKAVTTRMDYARVKIGESDFLLPAESEMVLTDLEDQEYRDRVRLTSCREFTGESVLTFDEPPADSAPKAAPLELTLPADLTMQLRLEVQIDTESTVIGDALRATLENDLKQKGQLLMPKGATVQGRVTRMEKHGDYSELGLEFDEIDSARALAHFAGTLDSLPGPWFLASTEMQRRRIQKTARGESVLILKGGRVRIPRGTILYWRTIE